MMTDEVCMRVTRLPLSLICSISTSCLLFGNDKNVVYRDTDYVIWSNSGLVNHRISLLK